MLNTASIGAFFGVLKAKFAAELTGIEVSKLVVKAPHESLPTDTVVDPSSFKLLLNDTQATLAAVLKPDIVGGKYRVYVELPVGAPTGSHKPNIIVD